MQAYKAPDNSLHYIDSAYEHLLPVGCVRITDAEADSIRMSMAPVVALEEVKEQAKAMVRAARKPVFYTLAGMQSEALAMGDGTTATAIVAIQQALRDLPETDLSACTTAESVAAVFMQAWAGIKALAPVHVASAFNEVLAP